MIVLDGVYKGFDVRDRRTSKTRRVDAVLGASLRVEAGEVVGLFGPNGAGKTTTLRMIAGLMKPDAGTVRVNGFDTGADAPRARGSVGYLSTELSVNARFTPSEYLRVFGQLQGLTAEDADRRGRALLERLQIAGLADVRMEGFSTGEQQKVSIARALIHDPAVVVLDEPTNGLDVFTSRTVLDLVKELRSERRAVVVTSHVMTSVARVC